MKLKSVTWVDSASRVGGGWHTHENIEDLRPIVVKTAGFVVHETKDFITIASQVTEFAVSGEVCIPKFAILREKKLK